MAIIYSYPTVIPTANDLVLGTDVDVAGKPTKNFTVQSIIDLVTVSGNDLQAVLNNGNVAVGKDINITGNAFRGASFISVGGITLDGTTGTGFTNVTSTAFTGTIATPAQPNITSLGTLTSLKVGNATPAITSLVTSFTAPGDDVKLATTKAIVDYIGTNPPGAESLAATLLVGNTTGATKIEVDNTGSGVDFIDLAKARFGTGNDLEIYHDGTDSYIDEVGTGNLKLRGSDAVQIYKTGTTEIMAEFIVDSLASLYYDNSKKFETSNTGVSITGNAVATGSGTFVNLINSGTYSDSSADVGNAGQILSSTGSGTNWITNPNPNPYTWDIEADSGAGSPYTVANGDTIDFVGVGNINTAWNSGNKELEISLGGTSISGTGADTQVVYWTGAQTVAGDAGMVYNATTDYLTLAGTVKSGTFTTTAGTASWSTTVMTGFTSITSTDFVGDLTGNADTATALASVGAITLTGDTSSTGGPYTYTSGGALNIATTILDTTVTGKVLTGLPTPAAASIVASDTILEAFGKTQSQINSIANGLQFQGTWNATTNSPTLASGGGEATSGTTTATTANKLVDSGANFTATVTVGDKVINQVDGQTALVSNIDSATTLSIDADIMLTGEAYTIDNTPFITQGHYYVVSVDGSTALNGISDWKVGDWVIAGATNVWEKLDNTAVQGTGTANYLTKWNATGVSAIVDSGVTDDGSTIKLLNDVELGALASDTTLVKGPATFDENVRFNKSISLGAAYGTAGYALTSGGGAGAVNTWAEIPQGTVESVTASTGIVVGGTAVDPTVAILYAGASNAILATSAETPVAADTIWFSDATDSNIKKSVISNLPFDQYTSWTLAGDSGSSQTISSGNTATIAGGTGIITDAAATDTLNVNIDYVGNDNAIEAAADGTSITVAGTDKLWVSDATDNTIKQINASQIQAVSDQALSSVLAFGNTSGANDILMADNQKVSFGGAPDFSIYHNSTSNANVITSLLSRQMNIQSDTLYITNQAATETMINATANGAVTLYYDNSAKLATTTSGVSVTGALSVSTTSSLVGDVSVGDTNSAFIGMLRAGANYIAATNAAGTLIFRTGGTTPAITIDANQNIKFDDYGSGNNTGTAAYNLEVDSSGNIIETPATNPGGKSGTFYKEYTTGTVAAGAATAFTLTRATSGTLVFTVYLTATLATNKQVAKMYQVAHTYGQTPVYNKVIDTGPLGADITVAFADSSNTAVTCSIAAVTEDSQPVGITVVVGHGATAVTFA